MRSLECFSRCAQSKGGYREGMSGSEEEGEHDAYMERMKAEGEQRDDDGAGDDDDDDSTGTRECFLFKCILARFYDSTGTSEYFFI